MSKLLMRVDGSCYPNPGNMAIGIVIYRDGELIKKISETIGYGTNNIAEYKALIRGLEEIKEMKAERIDIYCDSQLVVKQLNGIYKVKDKTIIELFKQVESLVHKFTGKVSFIWEKRDHNRIADQLARKSILLEERKKREKAAEKLEVIKGEGYFLVSSSQQGKYYRVDPEKPECDCEDFTKRAFQRKMECKHIIAVKKFIEKEEKGRKITSRPRMKVLILSRMVKPEVWKKLLTRLNRKTKIDLELVIPDGESKEVIKQHLSEAEVVIGGNLTQEDLVLAKKLKLLQIPFAGVDQLDFNLFKQFPSLYICNVHTNKEAVAEHAFALLLALAKKVVSYDRDLRKGIWHGFSTGEPIIQLKGKSLGIIGLGSIGWEIALLAKSFGMQVYALKHRIKRGDLEKKKVIEFLGESKDLSKVIKKSDFIIITLPLTSKTKGLIGYEELKLMKGKYLINVARGEIIVEEDLYKVLKEKYLAGAAIDTWYQYPSAEKREVLPSKYDFHTLDNLVMSPHTAGYTDQALEENIKAVFDNLVRIYYGEEPESQVNVELEY